MSMKWPGNLIRKTPVTPAGPLQNGAAPGMWTLGEAAYWTKQGLWPTAGNFLAVEDVFSTWLYTGNGSTQTITNGIDLAGKGGLVWVKPRDATGSNLLRDTARGGSKLIITNTTGAEQTTDAFPDGNGLQFNSNGFSLGPGGSQNSGSGFTYASWTFREAPNFFDVVTYTGNGVSGRQIAHNLGVTPGMVIVKRTDSTADWAVWQRTLSDPSKYLVLNTTAATATDAFGPWGPTGDGYTTNASSFTDTFFRVANDTRSNASGATYVAYLFAHDTSSTGLIQCGSFTPNGNSPFDVNLGWEPQWVMIKSTFDTSRYQGDWNIYDNMRGMPLSGGSRMLWANSSDAEYTGTATGIYPTATGFTAVGGWQTLGGGSFIYIAIRRGPMRTPTVGTTVFSPSSPVGSSLPTQIPTGFPVDLGIVRNTTFVDSPYFFDRLRGTTTSSITYIRSDSTAAEATGSGFGMGLDNNTGITSNWYSSTSPTTSWNFRRAPSFFDEVCYTGTGSTVARNHNLGVAPELAIFKSRSGVGSWLSWSTGLTSKNYSVKVNLTNAQANEGLQWIDVSSTTFTVDGGYATNGTTYVAYLFATCPGVSKVGSYTGTGALQTINCGFTTGARFVLIKRTDSTGDWYYWDSLNGISSGNDPYLLLNSSAVQVTGTNYVDTDTTGFKVTAAAPAALNASGGSYIFLAVA